MLASTDGNDGYVGIYCTATVTYNGKTYQFITSEAFYPKFTNDAILTGSITIGGNTTVITPPDNSSGSANNTGTGSGDSSGDSSGGSSGDTTGTENGSGETQGTVEYIETQENSLTIDMEGGDGDYTVTVDEKLQDKVTVDVADGTITVTNTTDEPVAGTITVGSGNQTVDIPIAFITELTTSVSEIVLENVNGSTSEIICSGGTGVYTVEISDSLKGSVTVTQNGNRITLAYHYSSNVSGTIKIISGSQTVTINVSLTNPVVDCLTGDTLITMADGTTKRIDEITYGDKVLAINPKTGEYVATGITYTDSAEHKTYNHYDRFEFDDGTVITTVHRHRFFNCEDEKMIHIDMFSLGDRAYKIDGTTPKLVSAIEHYEEKETKHYTIFTEMQNYFANGLLSGNRFTKPIKISDIKGGKANA